MVDVLETFMYTLYHQQMKKLWISDLYLFDILQLSYFLGYDLKNYSALLWKKGTQLSYSDTSWCALRFSSLRLVLEMDLMQTFYYVLYLLYVSIAQKSFYHEWMLHFDNGFSSSSNDPEKSEQLTKDSYYGHIYSERAMV